MVEIVSKTLSSCTVETVAGATVTDIRKTMQKKDSVAFQKFEKVCAGKRNGIKNNVSFFVFCP